MVNKSVSVLVSTMHNDPTLLSSMKLNGSNIIVNQCDVENINSIDSNMWINTISRGLSISRNIAIKNSDSDISVIADDDLVYVDNYEKLISDTYNKYPDEDVIVFKVEGINKKFKSYSNDSFKINYLSSLKVSSVQVTFKTNKVKDSIYFNENFGSGAKYSMGEENIFLFDCLNSNLKIRFVPVKIADLYIGESTWFKGFNEKYLFDRGASFYAMSKTMYPLLIIQYGLRKYKMFKGFNPLSAIRTMLKGSRDYKYSQK